MSTENDLTLTFELWCRSYPPYMVEKCLAKGQFLLKNLLKITEDVNNSSESFVVPLLAVNSNLADNFLGMLTFGINYECSDHYRPVCLSKQPDNLAVYGDSRIDSVTMNIGILRASRLESIVKNLAYKNGLGCLNLDSSCLYIKYSLGFLNRPQVYFKTNF